MDESARVDRLRNEGAAALYKICREFIDGLNEKLAQPVVVLDPPEWNDDSFNEDGVNLFQISLRGRLLQVEFAATEEPYCTEEFRHKYVLRGGVRSFNQNFLESDTVDEQIIFYCPKESGDAWHFFDPRTYRTGLVGTDYLVTELERLL
jgi:riboflavin biosynthesis pyrimidine reductase